MDKDRPAPPEGRFFKLENQVETSRRTVARPAVDGCGNVGTTFVETVPQLHTTLDDNASCDSFRIRHLRAGRGDPSHRNMERTRIPASLNNRVEIALPLAPS